MFVIQAGADSGMDAVQFALLADSSYDWASLERAWVVLRDCLSRYRRSHPHPNAVMLATAVTLWRRQRPRYMDDVLIADSVQQLLAAVASTSCEERDIPTQSDHAAPGDPVTPQHVHPSIPLIPVFGRKHIMSFRMFLQHDMICSVMRQRNFLA